MNIQMSAMDGIIVIKIFKEKHDNVLLIIGLSANAFEGDKIKYIQQGMYEQITKSLKEEDFVKLMKKMNIYS